LPKSYNYHYIISAAVAAVKKIGGDGGGDGNTFIKQAHLTTRTATFEGCQQSISTTKPIIERKFAKSS
jgi:hypothetical protein